MKIFSLISTVILLLILLVTSCKKESTPAKDEVARKIQFQLYTDKDFSTDNHLISFRLLIQKEDNTVLWDSTLASMKIKEIPGVTNKLVIEKPVPGNDPSLLKLQFLYTIENVGISWYIDTSSAGQKFKLVDFNFR